MPFVPPDFVVPRTLVTDRCRLEPLTVRHAVADWDAVMSSREHLSGVFGPGSRWPRDDLSLEQNLVDLGWHQKKAQLREAFAYTVLEPASSRVVGCVYLDPSEREGFDAEVQLWVRASEVPSGLDPHLHSAVRLWVSESWPFTSVAYPGREHGY